MTIRRIAKTRVKKPARFEIYHVALMPEFLIADTDAEARRAKRKLEEKHGGRADIQDLETGARY